MAVATGITYTVRAAPHLSDGEVVAATIDGVRYLLVGTHETPLQEAGREARNIVRSGLADVLEWCGLDSSPRLSKGETMLTCLTGQLPPRGGDKIWQITTT